MDFSPENPAFFALDSNNAACLDAQWPQQRLEELFFLLLYPAWRTLSKDPSRHQAQRDERDPIAKMVRQFQALQDWLQPTPQM